MALRTYLLGTIETNKQLSKIYYIEDRNLCSSGTVCELVVLMLRFAGIYGNVGVVSKGGECDP